MPNNTQDKNVTAPLTNEEFEQRFTAYTQLVTSDESRPEDIFSSNESSVHESNSSPLLEKNMPRNNNQPSKSPSKLNPFERARYKGQFPDTRAGQISLADAFRDTYGVFNGGVNLRGSKKFIDRSHVTNHAGLFDYATLGLARLIPLILIPLLDNANNQLNLVRNHGSRMSSFKKFLHGVSGLISVLLLAPIVPLHIAVNGLMRPAFSFWATVVCSPIVVLAHAIAKIINFAESNKLAKETKLSDRNQGSTATLHSALKKHNLNLNSTLVFVYDNKGQKSIKFCKKEVGRTTCVYSMDNPNSTFLDNLAKHNKLARETQNYSMKARYSK